MGKTELQPYTFEPGPEDILTTPEAELLQAADNRGRLCPRCGRSLAADMMVSEVYQGVILTCLEGCGFRRCKDFLTVWRFGVYYLMMKTLEKSRLAQKIHQLYAPEDPQSRSRMSNTAMVIGAIAIVLLIIDLIGRFS